MIAPVEPEVILVNAISEGVVTTEDEHTRVRQYVVDICEKLLQIAHVLKRLGRENNVERSSVQELQILNVILNQFDFHAMLC